MRQLDTDQLDYSVELSPRMWTRVGALQSAQFKRLRARAAAVAQLAAKTAFLDGEGPPPTPRPRHFFDLEDSWAEYEIDADRGTLIVHDVVPTPRG